MNKLTHKDFEIGQMLICVNLNTDNYKGGEIDNERLILGEKYKIIDIDFHFPNSLCVKLKGPYYFHEEFVPIECFVDIEGNRKYKIDKILG
jgi:hypothetical protein